MGFPAKVACSACYQHQVSVLARPCPRVSLSDKVATPHRQSVLETAFKRYKLFTSFITRKTSMTATEQTIHATAPEAAQAAPAAAKAFQPGASSKLSARSAPLVLAAATKKTARRVVKAPAKKAVKPVKATAAVAAKPGIKSVANKAPQAATKPVATAAATNTAAKKAVANPIAKTAATVALRVSTRTPVKAGPKVVIAALAKPKVDKLLKAKKPKLVRDSFTIPKLEYLILEELKQRSSILGNSTKKSELIRAGIKALAAMADANFLAALRSVPAIKTGRPAKDR